MTGIERRKQSAEGSSGVWLVLVLSLAIVSGPAAADEDLVAAAKAAREKKKGSTTRVLTNADAKKAKGVLIERALPDLPADAAAESLAERHARQRKVRIDLEARLSLLQADVARLEKDLLALERSYYEENDLDHRDRIIAAKFLQTKTSYDRVAGELAVIQAELAALAGERP